MQHKKPQFHDISQLLPQGPVRAAIHFWECAAISMKLNLPFPNSWKDIKDKWFSSYIRKIPLSSVSTPHPLTYFHLALQAFQRIVSNCWTTGPKDRDFVFRPCKEQRTQCVYVRARSATLLSARKKEELEREKGDLTCKSLLLFYLPPLISSIATRMWAIMRWTHRLTALSGLNGCSWHVLHVHPQTHALASACYRGHIKEVYVLALDP